MSRLTIGPMAGTGCSRGECLRVARRACAGLLLVIGVFAQEPSGESASLDRQIAELRQSLQEETVRLTRLQDSQQAALAAFSEKRRTLAAELLDARVELSRLEEENRALAPQAEGAQRAAAEAAQAVRQVAAAALGLQEALAVHLAEVPGAEALPDSGDPEAGGAMFRDLPVIFGRTAQTLREAEAVAVKPLSLRTATGEVEDVLLLSVGHIAAAYQIEGDPGRIGLAMASPADAAGFRWTEDLPPAVHGQLGRAIRQLAAGAGPDAAKVVRVPVDVTGQLQSQADYGQAGVVALLGKGRMAMIPLLGIAVVALVLVGERLIVLYVRNPRQGGLLNTVLGIYRDEGCAAALDAAQRRGGVTARVLAACLSARPEGVQSMEDRIQTQLLYELPVLRRFLSGLAILAAVAPLLGLLGTVTGIIRTFDAMQAFGNANPHLLAAGISEALITTATGLVVAIPILLLRGMLSGRAERLIAEAESQAAALLHVLGRKESAGDD